MMQSPMDLLETSNSATKLEHSKLYTTLLAQEQQIDLLTSGIVKMFNDPSLVYLARSLSCYMLKYSKHSFDFCMKLVETPNAKEIISQFFNSESAFQSPDTIVIGVDMNCCYMAGSIQSALDVKQINVKKNTATTKQIKPDIKHNIIYSNKSLLWVRVVFNDGFDKSVFNRLTFKPDVVELSDNVVELYVEKRFKMYHPFDLIKELDSYPDLEVVFCSEGSAFRMYPQLFISNYVKFMYCYESGRLTFVIDSPKEMFAVNLYMMYALLFLETKNLSILPSTFSQFSKMSAERPRTQIGSSGFFASGPRDGVFIGDVSYHGGRGLNTMLECDIDLDFNKMYSQVENKKM